MNPNVFMINLWFVFHFRRGVGYLQYTYESNAFTGFVPIQNDVQQNVFNGEPTDQL